MCGRGAWVWVKWRGGAQLLDPGFAAAEMLSGEMLSGERKIARLAEQSVGT